MSEGVTSSHSSLYEDESAEHEMSEGRGKVNFGLVEHENDGVVTPSDNSTEKYRQYELQQALEDEIV